eukprot:CAMPEP_0119475610 /NCGR_PEP_ID=MMETSP1344-20130328/6432_1 /TAXON_ID=236787 /ORGANISM="Florenciella parvula, Strain CCMP2471" /LENGTH=311 /DNA_ID=CAMNT_0007509171 /DNA_START=10 /DNA_END=945 /DNA_ORIENTATION=-
MPRSTALIVLALATSAYATSFDDWASQHSKTYVSAEERKTAEVNFMASVKRVEERNAKFEAGTSSWRAGLNKFSDMTRTEFLAAMTTPNLGLGEGQNCSATEATTLPMDRAVRTEVTDSIDWREQGAVSEVKNQGSCGSCWTFSTTGCLESHNFLTNGEMNLLAEQQLVDCAGDFNNFGCDGGLPSQAFTYIHYNGGIDTEDAYPYTAVDGTCEYSAASVGAKVEAVNNITYLDEDQLVDSIGLFGPVSIAYQVASDFGDYAGGVYTSDVCENTPESVNHAVLAVGYDRTLTTESMPYFIVKNSWGTGALY